LQALNKPWLRRGAAVAGVLGAYALAGGW